MTIDDPGAMRRVRGRRRLERRRPADTITGLGLADASGTVGGTTYQWDAQTRELTVTHLYEDDNPTATTSDTYAVALVVRDDDLGASDPYNVDITVGNVRPVLIVAADQTVDEGALLDLSGVGSSVAGAVRRRRRCSTPTRPRSIGATARRSRRRRSSRPPAPARSAHAHLRRQRRLHRDRHGHRRRRRRRHASSSRSRSATSPARSVRCRRIRPVNEGSTATVSVRPVDPSAADTLAGFRYAYDLDNTRHVRLAATAPTPSSRSSGTGQLVSAAAH